MPTCSARELELCAQKIKIKLHGMLERPKNTAFERWGVQPCEFILEEDGDAYAECLCVE